MDVTGTNCYDVAVVGLGVLGSAAAYYAAKKGAKVIAFEQFELGHVQGASHDTSRIVRTSYELPEYVALAQAAYKGWAELEADAKQRLLTITGGVVFLPKHGGKAAPDEFENGIPIASEWAKGLDANNIPYELLDHQEANRRWPALRLEEGYQAIYTADTGIVHAAKSVTAMQFLARMHGAEMLERAHVEAVTPNKSPASGVTIRTTQGIYYASKIVIAADAWVNELIKPLNLEIPLSITQEQVTYFKPSDPDAYQPDQFPVWVWVGQDWYYGFPCYGEPTIKAGHDNARQYMSPATRTFVPDRAAIDELASAIDRFAPDPGRQELRTVTCQYARTPNRQFVIDTLKEHQDIILALGSAHGFKFAPAIGRIAAELAIDGKTSDDISTFRAETVTTPIRRAARL